jgi:dihydrofolate synthase/folylpolyglutamate synthase
MTYEEVLEWMFAQIPMYQRQGRAAYKADLSTTEALDAYLNHPHQHFRSIHVGGTNGKGSVSNMMASVLQQAGYKTGLYTSPHLKDFRERIRVDGQMVEKDFVMDFIQQHASYFQQQKPSFFEMTVAMAFEYFKHQQVDVAVVEVGLGGRLDSTNIIDPDLSIITNISLDHTQFLGDTVEQIAGEKAGIIKSGKPLVVGEYDERTAGIFREKARSLQAPIYFADQDYQAERQSDEKGKACYRVLQMHRPVYEHLCTDLLGSYQSKNLVTALAAVEKLRESGYTVTNENIYKGLANVSHHTGFVGRWFILQEKPTIVCDTAHNEAGLSQNISRVKEMGENLHFVLGFVNDKRLDSILQLFPSQARYYFTRANIPRALDQHELARMAASFGLQGQAYASPQQALEAARKNAAEKDIIYVGGSTFLVSELI